MASDVIDLVARRKSKSAPAPARPFERISVHLSSLENRTGTSKDQKVVSEEIRRMISTLEGELENGGEGLRRHVESHIGMLSSGLPDPVSPAGVRFHFPEAGAPVTVGDGEASRPGAEKKIQAIVSQCMEAAESDLKFLRESLTYLDSKAVLPAEKLRELRIILGNNSYWRYFEPL